VKRAAHWVLYATILIAIFLQITHGSLTWLFGYLVMDGETYEGVQLLAAYAIIAVALYFLPVQ
jgi:cytochrome b subunit of formate dehydrogenase